MKSHGLGLIVLVPILTYALGANARGSAEECLTHAEATRRWPEVPLVVTRRVEEIGIVGGLGMGFSVEEDGALLVSPDPDSPARRAGINRNDRVIAIDEKPITAFATDREIVHALRGKPGTSVMLTLERWVRLERVLVRIAVIRAPIESVDFSYCWGPNGKYV